MDNDNTTQDFPLVYQLREPDPALADGSSIFMLHGVGSNEQDLFSLAGKLPKSSFIFSLRGPIQMGPQNFGWYQVDFSSGKPTYKYAQVEHSRDLIIEFIATAIDEYDLDPEKIVLFGFSQGTIMSYSVAIAQPDLVVGIAAFSGRILIEDQEDLKEETIDHVDVFLSHSKADKVLPFAYAEEAAQALEGKVNSLEIITHGYGHAIDPASLDKLNEWFEEEF